MRFYKDENGLLYIDLEDSEQNTVALLISIRVRRSSNRICTNGATEL